MSSCISTADNRTAERVPATGLSYVDVPEYRNWINAAYNTTFRLPTLMEWEYMAAEVMPQAQNRPAIRALRPAWNKGRSPCVMILPRADPDLPQSILRREKLP